MVEEGVNPKVAQEEGVESMVDEVVLLPGVLVDTGRRSSRLRRMNIPFVGETPTGEENTRRVKFPPRSSKNFFICYLRSKYFKDNQLSVDHFQVNLSAKHHLHSEHKLSPANLRSRTNNLCSHSSRSRSVHSRQSVKTFQRVEQNYRRLHISQCHQRSLTTPDRQATNQTTLTGGVRRVESGPGDRRGLKGSSPQV